jgi:hypothetical protein
VKSKFILIPWIIILCYSLSAFSAVQEGCNGLLTNLAKSYLKDNYMLLSCFEMESGKTIDIDSLILTDSNDLDLGSYNLRREITLQDADKNTILLYSTGDLWCNGEKILGIKEIENGGSVPDLLN